MKTRLLLLLQLLMVASQSTTDDDVCDGGATLSSQVQLILQQQQLIIKRLGKRTMNRYHILNVSQSIYTLCLINAPFYICNNSLKTESISINDGTQYSEKILHQKIINSLT